MADDFLRHSALAHLGLEARALDKPERAGVVLCERPFRGQLALRGDATRRRFKDAVEKVLGADLPVTPNTVSRRRGMTLLWLGPSEWLVVMPDGREQKAAEDLSGAFAGTHFAITDVSNSRTVVGLAGRNARDLLMKGCSLDLHPRVFSAGQCAQSSLARCHMLLHQINNRPEYDIYVHRSFADYTWRWLEDAATEYGVAVRSAGKS